MLVYRQSVWSTDKFREKAVSLKDFFSTKSKSSKEKESLQNKGSDTNSNNQMLPWISCKLTIKI